MEQAIINATNCYKTCAKTITHCLEMGGEHANPGHIKVLMDCAKICHLSTDFMIRESTHHKQICGVCAEICSACADRCERLGPDDQLMQDCARICRECAKTCGQMAS